MLLALSAIVVNPIRLGITLLVMASWVSAADKTNLRGTSETLNQFQQTRAFQTEEIPELRTALGLSGEAGLRRLRSRVDKNGQRHSRYRQLYRGIPVWGERIVVTKTPNNEVVNLVGTLVTGIENDLFDTTPSFRANEALKSMKSFHKQRLMNAVSHSEGVSQEWFFRNESSELVIFVHQDVARLSYAVSFFSDLKEGGHPTRPTFLIDANTKELLYEFDELAHMEGTGPGGNLRTGEYHYGSDFDAFMVSESNGTCTMENEHVKAINLNHGTEGTIAFSYPCYENTFKEINGAFSPINDAFSFGKIVFDLYQDWYATAPLNTQLVMKVHYANDYENAFWDGSSMTFGDGHTRFHPLVSLDVVSHEVSHGFTEQNSDLIYAGQSGGINEAFSDMAGEAAEFYLHGSNDWKVGAQIFKDAGALRYMDDPTQDGISIDNANDYTSGMDVHYSSGVYNKAFYVLATTEGWDTRKAFDVFVKANRDYWTPSTDFGEGAFGVRDAASDLGYSTSDVESAFAAVGIDLQGNCSDCSAPKPPCQNCDYYAGTLAGTGDYQLQPNGSPYNSTLSGYHEAWLEGVAGTDFDLELYNYQWTGSQWVWVKVAQSIKTSSSEFVSFYGVPGYYIWRVVSYNGSGSYDFWLRQPK